MTATVKRKDLEAAVRLAAGLAHGAVPICSCVLVRDCGAAVEIQATDLAGALRLSIPKELSSVESTWSAVVSPKTLAAALRMWPAAETAVLTVDEAGRLCVVLSETTRAELPTAPRADWPMGAEPPPLASWVLPAGAFAAALQTTAKAASLDREPLESVHVRADGNQVVCTSTDGRRMHRTWCDAASQCDPAEALIRSTDVGLLQGFLAAAAAAAGADDEASAFCQIGEGWFGVEAKFLGATQRLTLRQVEGMFPNTDQVIPEDPGGLPKLVAEAAALSAAVLAVRRVEGTDGRETAMVRLRVDIQGAALLVDSGTTDPAHAYCLTRVEAELSNYAGAEAVLESTLDARFLDEWLQSAAAAGGKVTLMLRGERVPVTLQRSMALAVVMPMAV